MTSLIQLLVLPGLIAGVVAYFSSGLVRRFYINRGWLDDPTEKQHGKVVHTQPVPRGGGVVIFAALLVGVAAFMGFDKHSIGIVLGAMVLTVMGVWDDVKDINPYMRLLGGLVAAAVVVGAGIGIAYVTNPLGDGVIRLNEPQIAFYLLGKTRTIWVLADIFALLWITWSMNMLNWSKGLDGQLPGIVVVAAAVIGLLSLEFSQDVTQWSVTMLAGITAGAYLGFLPWNFFPQKMMPGYGGGSLSGYLLAVLSILSGAKLATMIIVLAVPMIDAVYVVVRRILRGRSPVWGDRRHFHHLLLDLHWSKRQIAVFYWAVSLILGLLALQLNARQKMFTIMLLLLSFGGVLLWLKFFILSSKQPDRDNG